MPSYVRAIQTFDGRDFTRPDGDQSYEVSKGDVLPDTDWVARNYPQYFQPVEVDFTTEETAEAQAATRREMATLIERNGKVLQNWPAGHRQRYENLERRHARLKGEIRSAMEDRDERMERLKSLATNPENREHGSIRDSRPSSTNGSSLRDSAMRIVDAAVRAKTLPESAAGKVQTLVDRSSTPRDRGLAAEWTTVVGDPAYLSAFMKVLANPTRAHILMSQDEQRAYTRVTEFRTAMGLGADHGAEMVPLTLDPAILLTSDGSTNPLRRISRTVQTATNAWQGVTSAGATAEWKAEHSEASDGSPTLADVSIPVHFGDVDVLYSYEIGMDASNFLPELQRVMTDAADQLQATAFTTGSGSGQPMGIVTALAGTSSEVSGTGSEALAAADAFKVQNALPPRFSANAQWCANLGIINTLRQEETNNGALKFPELAGNPPRLLTKPMNENSNMDGVIDSSTTADNYVLLYGDFSNFVIVDRIGTTVEILPNYGANRRPTGERHAFLYFRSGSDVVVPNAFRMLNVATTA